ncbi:MAG: hypothetical protein G01um101430_664 [Parcubacteria group bacterium Gr01-1014_30]|nr:MAG: hypothetical protein G01um101430_664 [Parcubacteria group bacterium Gr01-1014_30]
MTEQKKIPYRYLVGWMAQNDRGFAHGTLIVNQSHRIQNDEDLIAIRDFVRKEVGHPTAYITAFSRFEE